MKALLLFCLLFTLLTNSYSQKAEALLQKAMTASGNWTDVKTLTYRTTGKNYNKWQNYRFQKPVPTNDEAFRSFDFGAPAYYFKTVSRYGGGYVFEFANVGKDTTRYVYDVLKSRNGHLLQQGGKRAFDAGFQLLNETFPFYALQAILQLGEPLLWESDTTVKRTLKDGSEEWLVFGSDGHLSLIRRVQKGLVTEKRFSDYRRQDGLYYPKRVSNWSNGELVRQDDVASLAVNQAFDQKFLVIPDGYKTAPPAPPMKATAIAKDVYLIEQVSGGRNVLFVDLADGVLVTEAPVSKEVSQGIIQLIQQTLPGKKIRYVHLSHFHNDHTTGINAFLAAGATLIATPATIAAVKTLVPPDLAASASFLSFTKEHQLQDAAHRIHFYEVPNTHAEGMSMVYLPQEQIIYQGDLYSLPDDRTITPAIATNRDFYQFLKRNKLAVKRIIGHHGASDIGMEDLEKAVKAK